MEEEHLPRVSTPWLGASVWPGLRCARCPDLVQRRSRARLEDAVPKLELPMLLALPHPHHNVWIKLLLGGQIVLLPLDCPCHLCVHREARVDASVGEGLGRGLRGLVAVGHRLAQVGQGICLEVTTRAATMRCRLQERQQHC
jgi:hypothetical protein